MKTAKKSVTSKAKQKKENSLNGSKCFVVAANPTGTGTMILAGQRLIARTRTIFCADNKPNHWMEVPSHTAFATEDEALKYSDRGRLVWITCTVNDQEERYYREDVTKLIVRQVTYREAAVVTPKTHCKCSTDGYFDASGIRLSKKYGHIEVHEKESDAWDYLFAKLEEVISDVQKDYDKKSAQLDKLIDRRDQMKAKLING